MVTRGGGLCTSVHEKHPVVVTHPPALTRRRNNLRTSISTLSAGAAAGPLKRVSL
jgi:hypothetical protein